MMEIHVNPIVYVIQHKHDGNSCESHDVEYIGLQLEYNEYRLLDLLR